MADKTVKVTDSDGNKIEVPVGLDGKTPVTPNNPSPKAVADEPAEKKAAEKNEGRQGR